MLHDIINKGLNLLNIGYSELNANWNWKNVYSPFARIYYVKEGSAATVIGGRRYEIKPGHLYLIPPYTLHDNECSGPFSLYYIHFYEDKGNRESFFDMYDFPVGVRSLDSDLATVERLQEINPNRHLLQYDPEIYDNMPTFSKTLADSVRLPIHTVIETHGILYQLMSRFWTLAKPKATNDERIEKALRHIHENVEKNISVSELADISYMTLDHFIRIFRKEMKYTPLAYIHVKKIERAQLLLLTTDMMVKDVAMKLSIENISYFNRLFKRLTGNTPGQYRNIRIE